MPNGRIADLFRVRDRFLRSVNLERDFRDADTLRGYVITPHGRTALNRLAGGLSPQSGQRAWRITGDYGSGKSSFALALAHLFSGRDQRLPDQLRSVIDFRRVGGRPNLLPILVTGSRAPLGAAIVGALRRSLEDIGGRGKPPKVLEQARIIEASAAKKPPSDARVLDLLTEAGDYLTSSTKATGILIILDELGKFLEFAAMHPDRQDVFFLQSLAEAATFRRQSSLFIVGILHQGFNVYADHLSEHAQREWEKVAGRFEEMLFDQPLEQTSSLVADALGVRVDALPRTVVRQAHEDMDSAVAMGWYGPAAPCKSLRDLAPRLYPLHPTVLPVLAKLFHRFGQNERSLFSFLFSSEPNGLRAFAEQAITTAGFYRIHHLYDYARACFSQRLSVHATARQSWQSSDPSCGLRGHVRDRAGAIGCRTLARTRSSSCKNRRRTRRDLCAGSIRLIRLHSGNRCDGSRRANVIAYSVRRREIWMHRPTALVGNTRPSCVIEDCGASSFNYSSMPASALRVGPVP